LANLNILISLREKYLISGSYRTVSSMNSYGYTYICEIDGWNCVKHKQNPERSTESFVEDTELN